MSERRTHAPTGQTAPVPRSRRWLAQGTLLWLLLPVVDVVGRDTGPWTTALSLAAVALFGGCFAWIATAVTRSASPGASRLTRASTGVVVALTAVVPLLRRDVEWTCLQVCCTIALALVLPLRQVGRVIAVCVAASALQAVGRGDTAHEVLGTALTVFGLGMTVFGLRKSRLLVHRLHDAQGEVARLAAVEERLRIARDLHDLVGHSLSLIVVKSELAGRLAAADLPAAAREISDVEQVARQSLVEVRDAVTGYRQRSLVEELDEARSALAAAGVDTDLRPPAEPLPEEVDRLFGWAVREGVTNVIRHARATRCVITVRQEERAAALEVVDDGVGPGADDDGPGNGLAGLAERVAAFEGRVTSGAGGRHGRGFRLTVRVPLPADGDDPEDDASRLAPTPPADAPAGL